MLEENSTLSCAASSLQAANGSGLPHNIDIAVRVFQVIFTIFRSILGVILNGLMILLIAKSKELRNLSFAIAIQLTSADLLLTAIFSLTVVNNIANQWILGLNICIASGFVIVMLSHVRDNLIIAFALERFALVFFPFQYPEYRRRVVVALCIASWLLGLVNSIVLLPPLLDCYKFHIAYLLCNYSRSCNNHCHIYHFVFVVTHIAPVIFIPAVCFTALYIKGRKIRHQVMSMEGEENGRMSDSDWRALKTFIILVLPSFLVVSTVLWSASGNSSAPSATKYFLHKLGANVVGTVVVTDAIIILKNADVKEALNKMVRELKKKFVR